jgi:hypothetical protein
MGGNGKRRGDCVMQKDAFLKKHPRIAQFLQHVESDNEIASIEADMELMYTPDDDQLGDDEYAVVSVYEYTRYDRVRYIADMVRESLHHHDVQSVEVLEHATTGSISIKVSMVNGSHMQWYLSHYELSHVNDFYQYADFIVTMIRSLVAPEGEPHGD